MPNLAESSATDLAADWRSGAADSPAGPLFTSQYTEADLVTHELYETHSTVTACAFC